MYQSRGGQWLFINRGIVSVGLLHRAFGVLRAHHRLPQGACRCCTCPVQCPHHGGHVQGRVRLRVERRGAAVVEQRLHIGHRQQVALLRVEDLTPATTRTPRPAVSTRPQTHGAVRARCTPRLYMSYHVCGVVRAGVMSAVHASIACVSCR